MSQLDVSRIRAITLDLDDTLWPIWPTIERAEAKLKAWLQEHAPVTGAVCSLPGLAREIRHQVLAEHPEYAHNLVTLRRECIRATLLRAGDDPALAEAAFEVFFAERQRVNFFDDALPALEFLSSRFPVVALSNGNADVHRVGIGRHFRAAFSSRDLGVSKPDPRMFLVGARAAGVALGDVLHIGDDMQADGVGALNAGMQMAWVNRDGQIWTHAPETPQVTVPDLRSLCKLLA
jgi:putative hydrolase of the HAD superfamily